MSFRTMKESGAPTYVDRLQTWNRYTDQPSNYRTPGVPFSFEHGLQGCGACGMGATPEAPGFKLGGIVVVAIAAFLLVHLMK